MCLRRLPAGHTWGGVGSRKDAMASAPGGLHIPVQLTPFIDRKKEIQTLRPLVAQQRMVSLVGPPGAGKTRLAVQLASEVAKRFHDGVWFVELAPLGDPAMVPRLVADTVGISEETGADPVDQLLKWLGSKRLLLVLDNCEQVVEEAARLSNQLLRGCPGLALLVTSRERLAVAGELVWPVQPMETPRPGRSYLPSELVRVESAMLFADRAWRARADFEITDDNAHAVATLLSRLEGLPLAIELAAAWSGTLSPADVVASLDDRFQLLTARDRFADPRHASLHAAIGSSYEALHPAEQSLFRQLGLFVGGWSLDAVAALSEAEASRAFAVHAKLVDRSLVTAKAQTVGPVRYRMLDSIRAYAVERLREAGELELVRDRLSAYYLQLAEQATPWLSGSDGLKWLRLLDAEHDNYIALLDLVPGLQRDVALRLTVALADYWRLRGHYAQASRRLKAAIVHSRERTPYLVRALSGLGMMAFLQIDQAGALRFTKRALAISSRIDDEGGRLRALEQLARVQFTSGDPMSAEACLRGSLDEAARWGDPTILSSYYFLLGQISLAAERYEESERLLQEAAELARQADHGELSALAWSMLGRLYLFQGRPAMAGPLLRQTLASLRHFGGPRHVVMLLDSLAAVAADEQKDELAARLAGAATTLHEHAGSPPPGTSPVWAQLATRWQRATLTMAGQKAYAEGRAMDVDLAISLALGEQPAPLTASSPTAALPHVSLTPRQVEIARLVAAGLTNRAIAQRLFISERTAEGHVEQIRNKLGFSSRTQIAAWVAEQERVN